MLLKLRELKGRPKRSSSDAAKEREADVEKVKEILSNLRKNELLALLNTTTLKVEPLN
jgi:hypothetical protein